MLTATSSKSINNPVSEGQIRQAFNDLSLQVDVVTELFADLEKSIAPILRTELEAVENEKVSTVNEHSVLLVAEINSSVRRLNFLSEKIREVRGRVEL